jgi:adenosyl cobinamide kinase/adenosyl cobinamide phosphate guanylyltransferase
VIILLDCLTLMLATFLFLSPLEAMAKRIRGGQQVHYTNHTK